MVRRNSPRNSRRYVGIVLHEGDGVATKKWGIVFDLFCNLARLLEFCTSEIPEASLSGSDINL